MFTERTSVGLDVHARSVAAAGIDGVTGELFQTRLTPAYDHVLGWVRSLPGPVAVTYEAGPTGFGHILPALGEVRLAEATTPLIDKVVGAIKADVSAATAKSCRSVISGVLGLAVRYGAVSHNPVREVERIEAKPSKEPRALTAEERARLIRQFREDEKARRKDLPDLVAFMLATGCRIGEALAVVVAGGLRPGHGRDHPHHRPGQGGRAPAKVRQDEDGGAAAPAADLGDGDASRQVHAGGEA